MYLAVDRRLAGVVAVADTVREIARQAVRALHEFGVQTVMLTGDNRRTAEAVARQLQIDQVIAEVLPEDKARKVSDLQTEGRRVAIPAFGILLRPEWAALAMSASTVTVTINALMLNRLRFATRPREGDAER
jgi:cation transport ATPase